MNKSIQYSDEPIGEIKIVPDFLPSSSELALKNQNTKVTIFLGCESVGYFKQAAKKITYITKKLFVCYLMNMWHIKKMQTNS